MWLSSKREYDRDIEIANAIMLHMNRADRLPCTLDELHAGARVFVDCDRNDIRTAMWLLIDRGHLDLTRDLKIVMTDVVIPDRYDW